MKNIWLIFRQTVSRCSLMTAISAAAAVVLIMMFVLIASPPSAKKDVSAEETETAPAVKVGIVDLDESPLSEDLKKYFTDCLGIGVEEEKNYDFQADMLIDKKISAIIEVPQGFYAGAAAGGLVPLTITTLDDYENAAFIESYADSYMRGAEILSSAAKGDEETFLKMLSSGISAGSVSVAEADGGKNGGLSANEAFAITEGIMMMFLMAILFFISNIILSDRKTGVYSRTLCSVIKPLEYVVGIGLFGVICCSAASLTVTLYIFCTNGELELPLGTVILVNELFVLFSVGTAVMVSLLVKSMQTLVAVVIGYTTVGCMLGGAWFPIADGLGALGHIAKFLPQYWVMDMIRNMPGDPGYNAAPNICILALFAVLSYLVSAIIFTRKNN
ncbi:MAG: ABC transporter permease [Prevotella sp.]|nr:ABC transporter permease [Prevotella sp.]